MSTGIVSKTGLTGATINGTIYEGTAYDKITTAVAAENLVAVAGGTYSDGQITMNGDTIIGGTAAPVVISGNVNTSQVNTCYGGGAVLVNGSENTISGVTFSENSYNGKTSGGNYGGGAVCVQGGSLTVSNSVFTGNSSTNYGGTLLITVGGQYLAVEDCYFSGNQGRAGAAILFYRGAGSVSGSTFANHTGSTTVYNSVNVTINDCVFEKNSALSLMVNDATTTVINSTFRNNTTGSIQSTGGDASTLILDGVTFTNNTCTSSNAAVYINKKLIIEKNGIVLDGNVGTQGAISLRVDSKECLIKGTITLMQSTDTIYVDSRNYQDTDGKWHYPATFKVDGASFLGDDKFAAKVVDARFATSWYHSGSKEIEFADGYKNYTYLNDLFVLADDAVIAESHPGIVDADALAGEAGAAKINGEVYFGKYYNSLLDAAKAESTVIYNGALYAVSDKDAAFVGAGATPADETAKIIDGTVYVGAQYDSVKNAAAAEKFILVQGGTYKSGGQIVPLAGTTISGSNGATISENTIGYDTNKSGGAAIYNSNGELTVSGVTFAYTTASGNTFAGLGSAISNNKTLTIDNCDFVGNTTTGGGAIVNTGTLTITNTKFVGNESRVGGALMFRGDHTDTYSSYIENCDFINNTATSNGGAMYIQNETVVIKNSRFDSNTGVATIYINVGGAHIYDSVINNASEYALRISNTVQYASSIHNTTISNTAKNGAVTIQKSAAHVPTLTLGNVTFNNNAGGALGLAGGKTYVDGLLTLQTAKDTVTIYAHEEGYHAPEMIILGGSFLVGDAKLAKVVDANSANWCKAEKPVVDDAAKYQLYWGGDNDLYITTADTVLLGDFVNADLAAGVNYVTVGETGYVGDVCDLATALTGDSVTVLGSAEFADTMDVSGKTITGIGAVISGTVKNSGTLTLAGTITINADLDKAGTYAIAAGTAFNNADFSAVNISVDGSLYQDKAVTIATGVTAIGKYTTGVENLYLTVENGSLILREANVTGDVATFAGTGSNLMTNGEVVTFFADKSGADADNIATTIQGGKVESNLVGGAYVAAGNTAEVDKVELLIGGTAEVAAKVYAGGYLYGNAGDAEAAAEAQLTVDEVNINIDGGAVSTNMYGGAHARQNGNAKVDTVNITVTDGSHSRIYAGGWAEKGAVSSVGTSNVIISGGTVDYLYGAGANADGKTYVTTTNITVSDDAVVNTIFMGGRYGYSWVDNVNLTFAGENKELNRLSGVSSAGMDYAKATVVELATNVTANLIDYVDKFVINEGYTLTANNEFYLGNRVEGGAEPGVTTFDFITDGLDKDWTAVAGISDFTNAQFSINGAIGTWDGDVMTVTEDDLTIKLTLDRINNKVTLAQVTNA